MAGNKKKNQLRASNKTIFSLETLTHTLSWGTGCRSGERVFFEIVAFISLTVRRITSRSSPENLLALPVFRNDKRKRERARAHDACCHGLSGRSFGCTETQREPRRRGLFLVRRGRVWCNTAAPRRCANAARLAAPRRHPRKPPGVRELAGRRA